ncbi:MAG TPA: tetratricopeptide repeat protein [Bacteroidia bacterium]|nr:tetratricopeptide repeat protein [Bacteroidia bacterium]
MDKISFKKIFFLFFIMAAAANSFSQPYNYIDSIRKLESLTNDAAYSDFAGKISKQYLSESKFEEALLFLNKQIAVQRYGSARHQKLLVWFCNYFYQKKEYKQSLAACDSVLALGFKFTPDVLIKLNRLKGQNYFKSENYADAIVSFKEVFELTKKNNDSTQMDDALAGIGTNYWCIGDLTNALKYELLAAKVSRQTNDNESLSRILNTLGNINKDLKYNDEARKNYEECFAVAQKTNDREGMILSLSSISVLEREKRNFPEAGKYISRAIKYAEDDNNRRLLSGLIVNLARIMEAEGHADEAKENYNKALTIAIESGSRNNIATASSNLGFIATEEKNYKKSNEYLKRAFDAARQINDIDMLAEITGGFYDNYKALNQYREALYYLEQSKMYSDSILNDDKAKEITRLKTKFAVEQKETEFTIKAEATKAITDAEIKKQKLLRNFSIAGILLLLLLAGFIFQRYRERHHTSLLLAEKNKTIENSLQELKETQSELVETEKQREAQSIRVRIARDIHDEIGSGLTKITLLSDVARRKTEPGETSESLAKITSYSKNISSSLSEIVWAINPNHDTLASLVTYMKTTANHLLEDSGINYQLQFPENVVLQNIHPDLKRNIYLVMKEALNNALKYSNAKNIKVLFKLENDNFNLEIADDGSGFTSLAEGEKPGAGSAGNGLFNMQSRMEQMNCNLAIETSPGNGCKISASGKII